MAGSVRTRFNESPNQTIKTVCNTCAGKTLHKVLALLEKMSLESDNTGHEVKPHTLSELRLALEVATHILKDVYILPKKAKDTFKI